MIRLERGEVLGQLLMAMRRHGVTLGVVSGLGAVDQATVGLYRVAEAVSATELTGEREMVSPDRQRDHPGGQGLFAPARRLCRRTAAVTGGYLTSRASLGHGGDASSAVCPARVGNGSRTEDRPELHGRLSARSHGIFGKLNNGLSMPRLGLGTYKAQGRIVTQAVITAAQALPPYRYRRGSMITSGRWG